MYDNDSHVSYNPFCNSRVETASENTNYTWVVDNTTPIYITWGSRFRNTGHDGARWLNEISTSHGISELYDDFTGVRNVNHIKNVYGERLCLVVFFVLFFLVCVFLKFLNVLFYSFLIIFLY